MKVKNLTMYNCHRSNLYDSLWTPGNTFVIDGKTRTEFNKLLDIDELTLEQLYRKMYSVLDYVDYASDLTLEQRREAVDGFRSELYYYERRIREQALEEARLKYAPNKPSRLTSIWLTNETGINSWQRIITDSDVYKVSVTGEMFRTSSRLIPDISKYFDLRELEMDCIKYWCPTFSLLFSERSSDEYLFQGQVKVLEKLPKK